MVRIVWLIRLEELDLSYLMISANYKCANFYLVHGVTADCCYFFNKMTCHFLSQLYSRQ